MKSISYSKFKQLCIDNAKNANYRSQSEKYLLEHCVRLYRTFLVCASILKDIPSRRVLSLGAGNAYVEARLKECFGADVTIVDFDEMIALNKEYYKDCGIECHPMDLSLGKRLDIVGKFDLVMSCEVAEHLPIAPSSHIESFVNNVSQSGYVLITTPNFARLSIRLKILMGLPVLVEPESAFAPAVFANEGIHRREYVEREIIDAMRKNRIKHIKTLFSKNTDSHNLKEFALNLFPHSLKPTMIVVGQKIDT